MTAIRTYQSASGEWIATDDNGNKLISDAADSDAALAAFRAAYPHIAAQADADALAQAAEIAARRDRQRRNQ